MTFDNWIKDVKAKGGVDVDGCYDKQCMDLYNDYCNRVLNLKGKTGATCAKQLIKNNYLLSNGKLIKNYASFIPQKGDIAIWTGGTYGHVAICTGVATINYFKSIDQNWSKPLKLTEEKHNYTYMAPLYFFRPDNQENISTKQVVTKTITKYKVNTVLGLNIRAGAGTKYKKVGAYKNKTVVTVTETKNGWGKTDKGWIKLSYCKKV